MFDYFDYIEKLHKCSDCPIRRRAMEKPHSVFARIHRWHKNWWPGWKRFTSRRKAVE
jgi:hypothetical protein